MNKFHGFSSGKHTTYTLPAAFITDLLPLIDDLNELKVTMYFMWAVQQREGRARYLRRVDFVEDTAFMTGLGEPDALDSALARACARGTLIPVEITREGVTERLYFINSEQGRAFAEQVRRGEWTPGEGDQPVEIIPPRPNVYALYEQNIGALTPLIADALRDAERDAPAGWLEDAIKLAVEHNKRSWKYIQAILDRWSREGKTDEVSTRPDEQSDGKRYIKGKYADFIKH